METSSCLTRTNSRKKTKATRDVLMVDVVVMKMVHTKTRMRSFSSLMSRGLLKRLYASRYTTVCFTVVTCSC